MCLNYNKDIAGYKDKQESKKRKKQKYVNQFYTGCRLGNKKV